MREFIPISVPPVYKVFRLVACGRWDIDDDEATEFLVAAAKISHVEKYVCAYGMYHWLDTSYQTIPEASSQCAHVVVDHLGRRVAGVDTATIVRELQSAASQHVLYTPEHYRVLNPGDAEGKTWLFRFLDRHVQKMISVIVEAKSASAVLDAVADHPIAYGLRINPLDLDACEFAIYLKAGEEVPTAQLRVGVGTWLQLNGVLVPEGSQVGRYHEPYTDSHGMFWPQSCFDGELFWEIIGAEGTDTPYATKYKLASGAIVDPKSVAKPPDCYSCCGDAREHLTSSTIPDAVFCSQSCVTYAESTFALTVARPGGKKSRIPRIYGPLQGLPAVRAFVAELAKLPPYNAMDEDFAEEIVLRPLSELTE